MGMITAQRITAALLGGSMSTAQLETLLGTASGLAGWKLCSATESMRNLLIADTTAKTAWTGSGKAVDAMANISTDGAAVIADDRTLMESVFNTQERADAWFASATTRAAIWNSDKALTALAGSATGKARARANARYVIRSVSATSTIKTLPAPMNIAEARFIMIGWSTNETGSVTMLSRRSGSTVGDTSKFPGYGLVAATDNVMALNGPVNVTSVYDQQVYIGALEV